MSLAKGTRLGSFEVLAPLGAGGMGEVYRARDTRLGRDVALKVLPVAFVSDTERLARFEREARSAAALSHPNILVVYEVGASEGTPYVASELLEGETLREAIRTGLSTRKALDYASQIATGLAAAHEKGIVHRDVKPDNLFVTREGRIKILDFGLAKLATSGESGRDSVADTTTPGTILGSAGYMAPEQVRGLAADHRSDIFAFGAVLYEMLTRRRAFRGETVAETLTAILREDPPDPSTLEASVPKPLDLIVRRCLDKRSEERFQSTRDIVFAIEIAGAGQRDPERSSRNVWPWVAAVAVLAALGMAGWLSGRTPDGEQPAVRHLVLQTTPEARLFTEPYVQFALSPDGSQLAYAGIDAAGDVQLYLRALGRPVPEPIAGASSTFDPFFSRDGQWVVYWAKSRLEKVLVAGGAAPKVLCASQDLLGGTWGTDGNLLFASSDSGPLLRVSVDGGEPTAATTLERGEIGHLWPDLLPGGRELLFTARIGSGPEDFRIVVQSLATGVRRTLVEGATRARYARTGHLVYARAGALYAGPFDPSNLALTGPAALVTPSVMIGPAGSAQFSLADDGTLVFALAAPPLEQSLVWVDRSGLERPLRAPRRQYYGPRLSRDGKSLAVIIGGFPRTDLWTLDLATGAWSRLTSDGRENKWPVWTPDGRRVAFTSAGAGPLGLYWQPADGSRSPELLVSGEGHAIFAMSWSPDAKTLVFTRFSPETSADLFALLVGSGQQPRALVGGPGSQNGGKISPDGRFIAYGSDESGRSEVYVQPLAGGGKYQVSSDGGEWPVWGHDNRELFYQRGKRVMAVSVRTEPAFSAGDPRALFEGPYLEGNWDIAPDGHRFIMVKPSEADLAPRSLQVILNWFEELKRLAPAP